MNIIPNIYYMCIDISVTTTPSIAISQAAVIFHFDCQNNKVLKHSLSFYCFYIEKPLSKFF